MMQEAGRMTIAEVYGNTTRMATSARRMQVYPSFTPVLASAGTAVGR